MIYNKYYKKQTKQIYISNEIWLIEIHIVFSGVQLDGRSGFPTLKKGRDDNDEAQTTELKFSLRRAASIAALPISELYVRMPNKNRIQQTIRRNTRGVGHIK